jgi:hypothetical protein
MEMVCLLKTFRNLQMLFAYVTHLVEGLSLETLLALKVRESLICLVENIYESRIRFIRKDALLACSGQYLRTSKCHHPSWADRDSIN